MCVCMPPPPPPPPNTPIYQSALICKVTLELQLFHKLLKQRGMHANPKRETEKRILDSSICSEKRCLFFIKFAG